MADHAAAVRNAHAAGLVVPAFNVPYLPMVEPVVRAVVDSDCFAFVATARLEWTKFEGKGLGPVFDTFKQFERPDYVGLHLDHIPVIDEDNLAVDYLQLLEEAAAMGYHSLMIDGSRLTLDDNIGATRCAVEVARRAGIPCEAELGAVMGHEAGPPPPYEDLFASGRGFTDVEEARRFVAESGCDWLSVAIGNIHGSVSGVARHQKKVEARLNLDHLDMLHDAVQIPLVLHGGSGVQRSYVLEAVKRGIAKVNIGMEIRQAYEKTLQESGDVAAAQEATYDRTRWVLCEYFELAGTRKQITGASA